MVFVCTWVKANTQHDRAKPFHMKTFFFFSKLQNLFQMAKRTKNVHFKFAIVKMKIDSFAVEANYNFILS